jgi:trigger factor
MAFRQVSEKEKNKFEIEFLIERAKFNEAVDEVAKKKIKNITIPGFRKGKAPRGLIEKFYGKGIFYEDALNDCLPDAFDEAKEKAEEEAKREFIGRPEIDIDSMDDEEGVIVKAVVTAKPVITIDGYKGLEAEREIVEVTDEEVEHELSHVRERNSRAVDINDRAVLNGDIVNIDFEGYEGGKKFDGGTGEKYDLTIGSGSFIPGFEEQLIGKNKGDECTVNVTFPEDYHEKKLAGKPAEFKVKINSISKTELPELDDEFAKDVSEFDTLDEYKNDVRAKILEGKNKTADREVESALAEKLAELVTDEIPEIMIEQEAENLVRDYDSRLRMQGLDLMTYFKYTGQNLDSMRKSMMAPAEKNVKQRLALEKIAELESIEVTAEEINDEYDRLADDYTMEKEKVIEAIPSDGIEGDLKAKKALDFVKANAKITDKKPEEPAADESAESAESVDKPAKPKKRTTKMAAEEAKADEK